MVYGGKNKHPKMVKIDSRRLKIIRGGMTLLIAEQRSSRLRWGYTQDAKVSDYKRVDL